MMVFPIIVSSCGDSSTEVTPPDEKDYIVFDEGVDLAPTFDCDGGLVTISFSAGNNWTASLANVRADSWCTVSPNAGTAGKGSITIHVSANEEPDEKSAVVQLKSGTVTKNVQVTQKQRNTLLVTADSYEFADEGGTFDIEVKANVNYVYDIDEDAAEWLSCTTTRALSTSYLTFKVAPNEEEDSRMGIITITDGELVEEVTVYQTGTEPTIVISQSEFILSADGGNVSIEVSSNVDVEVEMPDEEWISENTTRAYSTHVYNFTVDTNEEYDSRSAEIVFYNDENGLEEIVVIRQMQRDAIVLAMDIYEVEASACKLEFEIEANVEFDVATEGDWITYEPATRGLATYKLRFNIDENTDENEREGKIIITSGDICQEIQVVQDAPNSTPSVSKMADYVVEVTDRIGPLFMQCETIEEIEEHLEEIESIKGVENVFTTGNTLCVEIKGGFPIAWIYTPEENMPDESQAEYSALAASSQIEGHIQTRAYEDHYYLKDAKLCFINQQSNCSYRNAKFGDKYRDLQKNYENAGFKVESINAENFTRNFIKDRLPSYELIMLVTHGGYLYNTHWIMTGEEQKIITADAEQREKLEKTITEFINDKNVLIAHAKEKRGGRFEPVSYIVVSESYLKKNIKKSFNNSIIFNTSCNSLYGYLENRESFAKVFFDLGAKVYLGYDGTNSEGKTVGPYFYNNLLAGLTVEEAYNNVDRYDEDGPAKLLFRSKDYVDKDICIVHPEPITLDATDITGYSATLCGQIDGYTGDCEFGFYWSTSSKELSSLPDLQKGENIVTFNREDFKENSDIKIEMGIGLSPFSMVYYRTYIKYGRKYVYGEIKSFMTHSCPDNNHPHAIDLGLPSGTKWACCNVDATSPDGYGGYYAWGETEEKSSYTEDTYKYCNDRDGNGWYSYDEYQNIGSNISGTSYDVARMKWGGGWRMPTRDEIKELYEKCSWGWTTVNGVGGQKVTGPNGNSIFLPAAGYRSGTEVYDRGSEGAFWSGSHDEDYSGGAYFLSFDCGGGDWGYWGDCVGGYSVRPVTDK